MNKSLPKVLRELKQKELVNYYYNDLDLLVNGSKLYQIYNYYTNKNQIEWYLRIIHNYHGKKLTKRDEYIATNNKKLQKLLKS